MNLIDLLSQPPDVAFTQEEEALITRLLAQAYWMDECAATNPDIARLAEKVRQRMANRSGPRNPDELGQSSSSGAF